MVHDDGGGGRHNYVHGNQIGCFIKKVQTTYVPKVLVTKSSIQPLVWGQLRNSDLSEYFSKYVENLGLEFSFALLSNSAFFRKERKESCTAG